MPPLLEGGVGFRDQVFLTRINVGFGTFAINPRNCIAIAENEIEQVFRNYPDQFWRSQYVVADLLDFAFGSDDLRGGGESEELLRNASGHITAAARTLQSSGDAAAAVQSSCLAAELSFKGVLAHLGLSEPERRKLGHRLDTAAERLIALAPSPSDQNLRAVLKKFPDYVQSRYVRHGLSRLDLIDLMHTSQFVAADAVRRVTTRNLASQIEADPETPARASW